MEKLIELIVPHIITASELLGVLVLCISVVRAFWHYVRGLVKPDTHPNVKFELANGMATALEFLMAGEILKTALVEKMEDFLMLGVVIVLRVALSLLIHFEMKRGEE